MADHLSLEKGDIVLFIKAVCIIALWLLKFLVKYSVFILELCDDYENVIMPNRKEDRHFYG